MGAVAWGALGVAMAMAIGALALLRWRDRTIDPLEELLVDLAAIDREERATDLAFDGIVGHLLLSDPSFVDSADRVAGQDDAGAGG
jgi:hypothetical protein